MSKPDRIYASPRAHLVDFAFDDAVAEVFPDMIRRSVPGYDAVISMLGVLAASHFVSGTRVYDLGCSLGAATLSVHQQLAGRQVGYVAVDNAEAMLDRCRENLGRHMPDANIEFVHADIRNVAPTNASVVLLNYTLQFIPPTDRLAVLKSVRAGLERGGALILSEKVRGKDEAEDHRLVELHHRFKAANGYSELEISQKRSALERVMQLDSLSEHDARLRAAGFSTVQPWFQCLNFVSLLAMP